MTGRPAWRCCPGARQPVVVEPDDPLSELSLADAPDYKDLLRGLPDERFVHLYLAPSTTGFLRPLDSSIRSAAVAADVDGDSLHIRARVRHDGAGRAVLRDHRRSARRDRRPRGCVLRRGAFGRVRAARAREALRRGGRRDRRLRARGAAARRRVARGRADAAARGARRADREPGRSGADPDVRPRRGRRAGGARPALAAPAGADPPGRHAGARPGADVRLRRRGRRHGGDGATWRRGSS